MEIGIIGFGTFGQFMASHLRKKANIFVYNTSNKEKEAKSLGVNYSSLKEICSKEIVIISVPMRSFESTLKKINPLLKKGTLVLDVCSVKGFACNAMKKILPKNVEIVGTHPLFGPNSLNDNKLTNLKIALCPIRTKKIEKIKEFCKSLGLEVMITTPKEHDRQMANSQALGHFIGHVINKMKIKPIKLSTKSYERFSEVMKIFRKSSEELFEDMQTFNPEARKIRKDFIETAKSIDSHLKK